MSLNHKFPAAVLAATVVLSFSACNATPNLGLASSSPGITGGVTQTPPVTPTPALPVPAPVQRSWSTDAMVFNGSGAWGTEVSSLESILTSHGATYQEVTSAALDAMSVDEMAKFGMMIFPGGSGGTEAGSVSADTHARIREAVQQRGVSYIGFCAGAFIAVAPAPAAGQDVSYGFGIVPGPELGYYYLEGQVNPDIAMTLESFADGTTHDLIWYGGPVTPNTPGGVVAKYPNGDPAITEIWSGKGFVMLSGVHPAAPQSVRDSFGLTDSDGLDFDLAWSLLNATLHQIPLRAF